MKRLYLSILAIGLVVLGLGLQPSSLTAGIGKSYVLSAGQWGAKQDAAVFRAGGTVVFSHGKCGVAVVESDSPDFIALALAQRAFTSVAEDQVIQWQPPAREIRGPQRGGLTPGDETFINTQWNITAVDAAGAWAAGFTGDGVRVAVIDGGIWDTHIDLVGRVDVAASKSFVYGLAISTRTSEPSGTPRTSPGSSRPTTTGSARSASRPKRRSSGSKPSMTGAVRSDPSLKPSSMPPRRSPEGGAGADVINMSLGATLPRGDGHTGIRRLCARP